MNIEPLLRQPEGKTLEFKRDLSSPLAVMRTLVAFANTAGGTLLLGVSDDRSVLGVEEVLATEERLANLIADTIEPRLLPEIEIVPWRQLSLILIQVHTSSARPHFMKKEGAKTGTYVRLGSTNRKADAELQAEFQRQIRRQSYDEQPMPALNAEAIDFAAASEYFSEFRKLRKQDLETLGVLVKHQSRTVPTVGGMILFGKSRATQFPDAWIQAGRFDGSDKIHLTDRAEIRAYPVTGIDQALTFIERNTRLQMKIGRMQRRDIPALPPLALREALINAVAHADYAQSGAPIRVSVFDNRVEIENPGMLLPGLTTADLRDGVSRIRNRVIGRVFQAIGLVEQWGTGIQRMSRACVEAGLPEPEFNEIASRFRVTLYTEPTHEAVTDDTSRSILEFLDAHDGRSTADIADHVGLTSRTIQTRLARLAALGLAVAVGSSPRDPRRKWYAAASQRPERP